MNEKVVVGRKLSEVHRGSLGLILCDVVHRVRRPLQHVEHPRGGGGGRRGGVERAEEEGTKSRGQKCVFAERRLFVCVCVSVFIKLYITAPSGRVILAILYMCLVCVYVCVYVCK